MSGIISEVQNSEMCVPMGIEPTSVPAVHVEIK